MGDDIPELTEGRVVRYEEEYDPKQTLTLQGELPSYYKLWIRGLLLHWQFWAIFIWPGMCALVFLFGTTPAYRCLFVTLLMAGFWIMKVMPLGVTGLIPVALFPFMEILGTLDTCKAYISDSNTMFVSALTLAFGIEATGLHKRIALCTILLVGTTHVGLFFGICVVTLFLSFWSGNTATTALMCPVAMEILKQLEEENLAKVFVREATLYDPPKPSRTTTCYLLGIAYAATIGGTGTLVGTGANLAFKALFELNVGMDQLVLEQKTTSPEKRAKAMRVARSTLRRKLHAMGRIKWAEIAVACVFLGILSLWLTMQPTWIKGWGQMISDKKIGTATPAVCGMIMLFMIPSSLSIFCCLSKDPSKRPEIPIDPILVWSYVNYKMIWSNFLLLGGGVALAKGFSSSGLTLMLSRAFARLVTLPPYVVLLIIAFFCTNFTELTSNNAVVNIVLPLISQMAVVLRINPIYLMLPSTLCCQFAFMLPVGTPSNAVVAGYGHIRFKEMALTGIVPSIITYVVVVSVFPFWGSLIYDLKGFPDWANEKKMSPP